MFNPHNDIISSIFTIIKDLCTTKDDKTAKYAEIEKRIVGKKMSKELLDECISQYVGLSVLYLSKNKNEITLL